MQRIGDIFQHPSHKSGVCCIVHNNLRCKSKNILPRYQTCSTGENTKNNRQQEARAQVLTSAELRMAMKRKIKRQQRQYGWILFLCILRMLYLCNRRSAMWLDTKRQLYKMAVTSVSRVWMHWYAWHDTTNLMLRLSGSKNFTSWV